MKIRNILFQFKIILIATFLLNVAWAEVNSVEEIKVALIGDTEAGVNFGAVLKMIEEENANVVMINGDLGYKSKPEQWKNRVISSINPDLLPVIGTLGNHDVEKNNARVYISIFNDFKTKTNRLKERCTGQTNLSQGSDITAVDEVCTFGNVSIIGNAIGQVFSTSYLEQRLESKLKSIPETHWKLVGYHFTLSKMTPTGKKDEATYKFFDLIRQYGAIGAQAHTHSAMATCPIASPFKLGSPIQCHVQFNHPEDRFVLPGTGIYVDSSLGGKEARARKICRNPNDSGCEHMVDIISNEGYTRTDGVKKTNFNRMGALFFIFNEGGDPSKARAYFKSIDGQVIFKFNITR